MDHKNNSSIKGEKQYMNRITINGKTVRCNGSNITIQNNNVIVDGKIISTDAVEKK